MKLCPESGTHHTPSFTLILVMQTKLYPEYVFTHQVVPQICSRKLTKLYPDSVNAKSCTLISQIRSCTLILGHGHTPSFSLIIATLIKFYPLHIHALTHFLSLFFCSLISSPTSACQPDLLCDININIGFSPPFSIQYSPMMVTNHYPVGPWSNFDYNHNGELAAQLIHEFKSCALDVYKEDILSNFPDFTHINLIVHLHLDNLAPPKELILRMNT